MPTFRIRTLMLIVVVVALPMAAVVSYQQRVQRFVALADFHRAETEIFGVSDLGWFLLLTPAQNAPPDWMERNLVKEDVAAIKSALQYVTYHWDMSGKYEEAAKHPWAALVADPPAPPNPSVGSTRAAIARACVVMGVPVRECMSVSSSGGLQAVPIPAEPVVPTT